MTQTSSDSLTAYSRLTAMVTAINEFRLNMAREGKSFAEIRGFLNGLHIEFEMLVQQIRPDRMNALRAQTIGCGVTLLWAQLSNRDLVQIESALSEIQTELMTLQMVLPDKTPHAEHGDALSTRAKEYFRGRINHHNL